MPGKIKDLSNELSNEQERLQRNKNSEGGGAGADYFLSQDIMPIEKGMNLCRVVDLPVEAHTSWIKCDDGVKRMFKFPTPETDPNFLLLKIGQLVLNQKYNGKDSKGKVIFITPYKDSHPEIYNMIHNNEDELVGEYGPQGWVKWRKVGKFYRAAATNFSCLCNVINRKDFKYTAIVYKDKDKVEEDRFIEKDWCVKNGKTLILVSNPKAFGSPITVKELLVGQLHANFGNYQNYDICIEKIDKMPYYQLWKADTLVQNKDIIPFVVNGKLSEEEANLELQDTSKYIEPSSYSYIMAHLSGKIKTIDKALNTEFYYELEKHVEAEMKSSSDKGSNTGVTNAKSIVEEMQSDPHEQAMVDKSSKKVEEEPKPAATPRSRKPASDSKNSVIDEAKKANVLAKNSKGAYFIDDLPSNKKEMASGFSGDTLTFNVADLSTCPQCSKVQPTEWDKNCVYCGEEF